MVGTPLVDDRGELSNKGQNAAKHQRFPQKFSHSRISLEREEEEEEEKALRISFDSFVPGFFFKTRGGGIPAVPGTQTFWNPSLGVPPRASTNCVFLRVCIKTVQKFSGYAGHMGLFGTPPPPGVPKEKPDLYTVPPLTGQINKWGVKCTSSTGLSTTRGHAYIIYKRTHNIWQKSVFFIVFVGKKVLSIYF